MIRLSGAQAQHYITNLNDLIWLGDENNVARLYQKNMGCGPRVQKVAHPWVRLTLG
jgi:hypothetical protein